MQKLTAFFDAIEKRPRLLMAALIAAIAFVITPPAAHSTAGGAFANTRWESGIVSCTTSGTTLDVDYQCSAWRFANLDSTGTVVIDLNNGTAAYAGTSADYTDKIRLGPGQEREISFYTPSDRTLTFDSSEDADIEWNATCATGY